MKNQKEAKFNPSTIAIIAFALLILGASVFRKMRNMPETPNEALKNGNVFKEMTKVSFTRNQMGDAWPFRDVDSVSVYCSEGRLILMRANNGKIYALNGEAKTFGRDNHLTWLPLDGIHITGKDIYPMLKKGKELCDGVVE